MMDIISSTAIPTRILLKYAVPDMMLGARKNISRDAFPLHSRSKHVLLEAPLSLTLGNSVNKE
jgi:hypothetical protein